MRTKVIRGSQPNLQPGSLLTYNASVYAGFDNNNSWNGKKALLLEIPMSDVLGPNSVLRVFIDGKCDYVGACYFEELVTYYGWQFCV